MRTNRRHPQWKKAKKGERIPGDNGPRAVLTFTQPASRKGPDAEPTEAPAQ